RGQHQLPAHEERHREEMQPENPVPERHRAGWWQTPAAMNFARDFVDAGAPDRLALVELRRDESRREWSFGDVADASARLATTLKAHGVSKGDIVMTLIGNRPEWVLT